MVKKAVSKNAGKKRGKNPGGRPRQDPDSLRTERLVLRIHPDLMKALTDLAQNNGITRSMLIERAMIALINEQNPGGLLLAMNGRKLLSADPPTRSPLGTPDSFKQLWSRVIGGKPANPNPQPPSWVTDIPGQPDVEDDVDT